MDPLVQKGIDQKWLFDTRDEAHEAAHLLFGLDKAQQVLYEGEEWPAMALPNSSGVSVEVKETPGKKFQAYLLIFVEKHDKPIEAANPYGAPILVQEATFVFQ